MIWFFLPRMFASVFTIIIMMALTRMLIPADYGRYNITLLIGTILFSFAFSWIASSIVRFNFARDYPDGTVSHGVGLLLAGLPIFGVVIAVVALLGPENLQQTLMFAAAFAVAFSVHEIALSGLRVSRRGPAFATVTVLRPVLGLLLTVSVVSLGYGYSGAVLGMAAGAFIVGLAGMLLLVKSSGIRRPSFETLKAFLAFGAPGSVVASGSMVQMLLTQTILATFVDLKSVGFFAAAQILAMRVISMPMVTLSRSVASTVFETHEKGSAEETDNVIRRQLSFLVLLVTPVAAPLIFSNNTVAAFIFDGAFQREVAQQLPVLALAAIGAGFQGSFLAYAFTLARRTKYQLYIMIGLTALQGVAALVLIWLLGPQGAPLSILCTAACGVLAYLYLGPRVGRKLTVGKREIAKGALGMFAYVPLGYAADQATGAWASMALVFGGWLCIAAAFILTGQGAMAEITTRFSRVGRRYLLRSGTR